MKYRLLAKLLGIVCMLIGATMVFSLPWAFPALSWDDPQPDSPFEVRGFLALLGSMAISLGVGGWLYYCGREARGQIYRKEAMAVVGLSWTLATVLGALPFLLSGTKLSQHEFMNVADAFFESQSGFSTTGATVITDLEDPALVPRSILFWRSTTHFLGGLGIIVLFVVILGQGSAGKALMRTEMPGPSQSSTQARMQHTAWLLFLMYTGLNVLLTVIYKLEGMSWFNALCHAFGTMATGGFSTYNASLGHFHSLAIESTTIVFMILAGSNFMLLYFLVMGNPLPILKDVEWRTYIAIIVIVTAMVVTFGMYHGDQGFASVGESIRYGLFQVVSIITTTGYGTNNFDLWNGFGRAVLFLLMFIGGCAGSTGGGMKVIRHILFLKILWLEQERTFHPTVVRPLRLGGEPVDRELRHNLLVYFSFVLVIFIYSWILLVTIEPDSTWTGAGDSKGDKLIDTASGVAATLNNIGPGLGTIGASENYAHFTWPSKLVFTFLMMLGRLEIFALLVLFRPRFWRSW